MRRVLHDRDGVCGVAGYNRGVRAGWLAGVLALLLGCGEAERSYGTCSDFDGDGRGLGCAQGPDCDDTDPDHWQDCVDAGVVAPDCEAEPLAPRCPCLRGERRACFPAAADSSGVGPCKSGIALCRRGQWSECEGVVLPALEVCNDIDDDCDGFTDEGVQSPCGGCDPACRGGVWGTSAAPFEADDPLALSPVGELTLRWQPHVARTLWVPNTDEGTVSKLDVDSARELARYPTPGAYPIGVAVDHRGDVWVLDGAFGGQAYVSKLAGDPARCETQPARCRLVSVPLMAADDASTIALDGALAPDSARAGHVWLGLAGSHALLQLDGTTGEELARFSLGGDVRPYASAFDRSGVLWLIDREGVLVRFDPADPGSVTSWAVPYACYTLDALSVDAQSRVLLSGFGCERVFTYDPSRDVWRSVIAPGFLSPRGIVSLADGGDGGWVVYASGQLARVTREPLALAPASSLAADMLTPYETTALSVDAAGALWAISAQGGPEGVGLATRFDPASGAVTAQVPVGRGPRARGDFSGYASGGEFAPSGSTSHVFGGCGRPARDDGATADQVRTVWLRLQVAAYAGAGASVVVSGRRAQSESALDAEPFRELGRLPQDGRVFALDFASGGVVEVKLDLLSPGAIGAPRVGRVGLEWECPGPD